MDNRNALIALYRDADFKAAFIAGYIDKGVHQYVAEKEFNNAFGLLTKAPQHSDEPPIAMACADEIKRTFLAISSYGLSFDSNAKEIFLFGEYVQNNKVIVTYMLGYRGMKRIITNTKGIRSHNTEIVYESDSFTWLGADQRPNYASTGRTQDSGVVCGFTTFSFTDGSVLCHRSNSQELLDIERTSIQQTIDMGEAAENSIYNSAWRERCLRILTLRAAFREHTHLFLANKDLVEAQQPEGNDTTAQAQAFEKMLNEGFDQAQPAAANM